jgi:hypothetical protein
VGSERIGSLVFRSRFQLDPMMATCSRWRETDRMNEKLRIQISDEVHPT